MNFLLFWSEETQLLKLSQKYKKKFFHCFKLSLEKKTHPHNTIEVADRPRSCSYIILH